jgi:hypothetical protein
LSVQNTTVGLDNANIFRNSSEIEQLESVTTKVTKQTLRKSRIDEVQRSRQEQPRQIGDHEFVRVFGHDSNDIVFFDPQKSKTGRQIFRQLAQLTVSQ